MDVSTTAPVPATDYFPTPTRTSGPGRWLGLVRDEGRELVRFWPVVQNMVVQELRVRYQRSFLGFLWTMLNPILMLTVMALVFSQLFRIKEQNFAVYLFAGMVPWNFLSAAMNDSAFCIIQNEGLIRKIYLPKLVFPLAKLLVNVTTFLLSLVALFALMTPLGAQLTPSLLFLPVVIVLFAAFTLGLGLIVAVANTFFRDCGHLVSVFLQAWYFATPIVYKLEFIPAEVRWRFWLNPAYPFIRMFQVIIVNGQWPQSTTIFAAAGIAAATLGIGYAAFKSYENKLVFRL
jgi:ABC-2 type transport system permease protein/lipopolysaccharide transport system permease protein